MKEIYKFRIKEKRMYQWNRFITYFVCVMVF